MSLAVSFTTDRYPPEQRVDAWAEVIREQLFDASIQPLDAGFDASCAVRELDWVSAFAFRSTAHAVHRTPESILRSPKSSVFVSVILAGQATYLQPGRTVTLDAGDALVYSASSPYLLAFQPGTRQLFLDVRQSILTELGLTTPELGSGLSTAVTEGNSAGIDRGELLDLAEQVADGGADSATESRILRAAHSLLHHALDDEAAVVFARAEAIVQRTAADPGTDATAVAAELGYSVRHANRLLATRGSTLTRLIAQQRQQHAVKLLTTTRMPLLEVASTSGFGSFSALQRQLQRAGLGTASEIRSGTTPF